MTTRPIHRVTPPSGPEPGAPEPGAPEPSAEPAIPDTLDLPPTSGDYDDNVLADSLRRVLASDPQLTRFMYYHHRPLLSEEDRQKYHAVLADPADFEQVKHDLLYPEETKAGQDGNLKRLMKIDYLRDALEWKENPMRPVLIAMVSEMILTDNYPAGMTMDMRLSLSGNKMELYELLYDVAPDQAKATLLASKGTRLEALVAYLAKTTEYRKQLESTIATNVVPGAQGSK